MRKEEIFSSLFVHIVANIGALDDLVCDYIVARVINFA